MAEINHRWRTAVGELPKSCCHRSRTSLGVEEPDFGDCTGRFDQGGLPVKLVSSAVPAQSAGGASFRSQPSQCLRELVEPWDLLIEREGQVRGLCNPERVSVAIVPALDLVGGEPNQIRWHPVGTLTANCVDRDRVDIEACDDSIGGGEGANPLELGRVDEIEVARHAWLHTEVQIPHEPTEFSLTLGLRLSLG